MTLVRDARRILVIKLSALGDVIQALAPLKAIRAAHADAAITWLTTPPYARLARLSPYADAVEDDGRPRSLAGWLALVKRLRAARYDLVYDLQGTGRTGALFGLIGARRWSGPARGASHRTPDPRREPVHSMERFAAQLRQTGALSPGAALRPDLSWVRGALGDGPELQPSHFGLDGAYALLVPGASMAHGGRKKWPVERYAALAVRVAAAGLRPVVVGGAAETPLAAAIAEAAPATLDLTGKTDLFQLVALAEGASVAVGNDTGPTHVAAYAGAPSVVLFPGFSDPRRHAPRGRACEALQEDDLADLGVEEAAAAMERVAAFGPLRPPPQP